MTVAVAGWEEVVQELRLDFSWFEQERGSRADLRIEIEQREPVFDGLPDLPASFVTPRNAVYQNGRHTVVDYSGRALAVFDREADVLRVQGTQRHLVHEIVYLFALSRIGEHLDAVGLTRIHALGLTGGQGGVIVLLASGGGKSTLALRGLREPGVSLLSDDTPLLDTEGNVHPFPLRVGVGAQAARELPAEQVRLIERLEYPDKYVVALDAFADDIATEPAPVGHIVIAERRLGNEASLTPVSRRACAGPLIRDGVVGLGIAQMIEWTLVHGARDVTGKLGTAASRAKCCGAALRGAHAWRLGLGRDHERNWDALAPLLA